METKIYINLKEFPKVSYDQKSVRIWLKDSFLIKGG